MKNSTRNILLAALPVAGIGLYAVQAQQGGQGTGQASGSAQPTQSPTIAVIDPISLVRAALVKEENRTAIEERQQEALTELRPLQQAYQQAITRLQSMNPQDAGAQQAFAEAQQIEARFQQARTRADQEFGRFTAELARDVYAEIHEAADAIADERGYDFVLSSRIGGELQIQGGLPGLSDEILARPVMIFPESDDITEAVRERLGLPSAEEVERVEEEAMTPDALPGAAPAGQQGTPQGDQQGSQQNGQQQGAPAGGQTGSGNGILND